MGSGNWEKAGGEIKFAFQGLEKVGNLNNPDVIWVTVRRGFGGPDYKYIIEMLV
jgi:hypothetical protein